MVCAVRASRLGSVAASAVGRAAQFGVLGPLLRPPEVRTAIAVLLRKAARVNVSAPTSAVTAIVSGRLRSLSPPVPVAPGPYGLARPASKADLAVPPRAALKARLPAQ